MTEEEFANVITDSMDMNLSILKEIMKDREGLCAAVRWVSESRT